ncbi:MAG: LysM peptidoglycan-binding domain-containing protein [Limnochordaceae bacterium]|nr:LysM peptidoglycan-binding domain-containing protein [Limnochordaceae bacterium]
MRIHVVQPGDTLWRISRRYGVPIESLIQLNRPPYPNRLTPGQALIVQTPPPVTPPPPPPQRYVVQPGDTLWAISRRFGVNIDAMVRLNHLTNPNLIYPGQVLLIPSPVPPATPVPPETPPYPARVNAYLVIQGESDRATLQGTNAALTFVSMFTYSFQIDGTLVNAYDRPALETARAMTLQPILTLANYNLTANMFDSELAHAALTEPEAQDRLVSQLLDQLARKQYSGLNVDFEYVRPEDREPYNAFMRRLDQLVHSRGLLLTSALAPKVSAIQVGTLYEAHDYPVHGQVDDYVVLMTYEWGWVGGPPMAIAPLDQVRRVLDYAVTAIPRQKILMGVPIYARDWQIPWQEGTLAEDLTVQEAVRRAIDQGAQIQFDPVAQSPFYRYTTRSGQQHEVWLEDARSLAAKFETVREYGLGGVSFWTLPADFPQVWPLTADRFIVQGQERNATASPEPKA